MKHGNACHCAYCSYHHKISKTVPSTGDESWISTYNFVDLLKNLDLIEQDDADKVLFGGALNWAQSGRILNAQPRNSVVLKNLSETN